MDSVLPTQVYELWKVPETEVMMIELTLPVQLTAPGVNDPEVGLTRIEAVFPCQV